MSLIRLAYASEATFTPATGHSGVEPHVARILLSSRRNNSKVAVVGGLYYGNHRFFQYLEGGEAQVRALYDRIRRDPRHRNVKTLLEEPLDARTFDDWSMKYVPLADDVERMLGDHGMDRFEPDRFDRMMCEQMVAVIRQSQGDGGLVNHDARAPVNSEAGLLSPAVRRALWVAGAGMVVVLAVGAFLLVP